MIPLNVSGPFHTAILAPASKKLAKDLSHIQFSDPSFPVISNTTTEIMKKETIAGTTRTASHATRSFLREYP